VGHTRPLLTPILAERTSRFPYRDMIHGNLSEEASNTAHGDQGLVGSAAAIVDRKLSRARPCVSGLATAVDRWTISRTGWQWQHRRLRPDSPAASEGVTAFTVTSERPGPARLGRLVGPTQRPV